MATPMFSNLFDATWKLIGHEKTGSAICWAKTKGA